MPNPHERLDVLERRVAALIEIVQKLAVRMNYLVDAGEFSDASGNPDKPGLTEKCPEVVE